MLTINAIRYQESINIKKNVSKNNSLQNWNHQTPFSTISTSKDIERHLTQNYQYIRLTIIWKVFDFFHLHPKDDETA